MKSIYKVMFIVMGLILLVACKPSDKYVGDWYAISGIGEEVMVNFSKEKKMSVTIDGKEDESHDIEQTATGIHNNIRYFKLDIKEHNFYVVFEDSKDEKNAKFIKQTNDADDFVDVVGDVIFVMNRDDFPKN